LDFSKLISGKITLRKEMLSIDEFTLEILRQLEPRLLSRGIDIEFEAKEVKPIEVDKNRMKQVLINILDNAIKFSPNDSKIVVKIVEEEKNLNILVEDYGYGISKDELPHVKEKFYKGRNINSSNGIGLSICDEIITQHGGVFKINSELQKGTQVIIMLPRGEGK
jgi:signal transduction histidine kinase